MSDLKALCNEILELYKKVEYLERTKETMNEYQKKLEEENRKLKYEYSDSKKKRDKPLPYKWKQRGGLLLQMCPKCEMLISNWQNYCHACGQKIAQGNPLPENEIKDEEE